MLKSITFAFVALACCTPVSADDDAATRAFDKLKNEIHTLSASEAKARLLELRQMTPPRVRQTKIEHFVVLLMENHAFDNMLGCFDLPGIDGIPPEGLVIEKSRGNASAGTVTLKCGTAGYICPKGPGYSLFDLQFKENPYYYPYSEQTYNNSYARHKSTPPHARTQYATLQ